MEHDAAVMLHGRARKQPAPSASGDLPRVARAEPCELAGLELPAHQRRSVKSWVVLFGGQIHRSRTHTLAAPHTLEPAGFFSFSFFFLVCSGVQEAQIGSACVDGHAPRCSHFIPTR